MKKSEQLSQYILYSKCMEDMMNNFTVNFTKECRSIIGTTELQREKFKVGYTNVDKLQVYLAYAINADPIYRTCLNIESSEEFLIPLAIVDLSIGTYSKRNIDYFKRINDDIIKSCDEQIKDLTDKKNILIEKDNHLFFRLFHPKTDIVISNITTAINNIKDLKDIAEFENRLLFGNYNDKFYECFVEEIKAAYGLMNLTPVKEDTNA